MASRKSWRPPLKSSKSLPFAVGDDNFQVPRNCSKIESFKSLLSAPTEDEELSQSVVVKPLNDSCSALLENQYNEDFQEEQTFGKKINWRVYAAVHSKKEERQKLLIKSPLIKSVIEGDIQAIEDILSDEQYNFNDESQDGLVPLHYACEEGDINVIKLLVKLGCDVNATNSNWLTSLHLAARFGRKEAVDFLLQQEVRPDIREKLMGRTSVHEATISPDISVLALIAKKFENDSNELQRIVNVGDKDARTALHLAAYRNLPDATKLLISAGADLNARDNDGLTPLQASLLSHRQKEKCLGVLSQLIAAGSDIEVTDESKGEKLLHFAARSGCSTCLQVLYEKGADLNFEDKYGYTPLHVAASENKIDCVEFLIKNGANTEARDKIGDCPLHKAILSDGAKTIETFLGSGLDNNVLDKDGKSYIQVALLRRKTNAFETLVKCEATKLPDEAGETVLHYCAALGFMNSLNFLLDSGWQIDVRDSKGRTALHTSLNHGHEDIATLLINRGAGLHETDETGATPLHYAVRWGGSDAILRLLIKKKAKLGITDRLGRTPLHYAASKFSIMSDMYILVGSGSSLNTQDNMGLTPLHLASRLGNESLVRILLENNAKHDLKDVYNLMPIDHAKEKNNKSIIKRLQDHDRKLNSGITREIVQENSDNEDDDSNNSSRIDQHRKSVCW